MSRLFLVVALLAVLVSAFAFSSSSSQSQSQEEWERFKIKFGKMYESPEEEKKRFGIFQENLRLFELRKDSYHPATKVGVTKFYDLTIEEWKERYFRPMGPASTAPSVIQRKQIQNKTPFPKTWDWTQKGVVTPVKNEEQCGSTWAMAALDVLESVCKIAGYPLISLSVQQVVDCDTNGGDAGCYGGFPQGALDYIINAGGIEPASDYPYKGQDNNCTANSKKFVECKPTGYTKVTIGTGEQGLQEFVYTQSPVIICIDAAQNALYDYTGGVLTGADCSATNTDHCVALEGWDFIDGQSAWKIKNQWGTDWGVQGYAYFQMGANTCGMDNPDYTIAPCVGKVC